MKVTDLTGQKFGSLEVISHAGGSAWNCRCGCGKATVTDGYKLRHGDAKTCGCKIGMPLADYFWQHVSKSKGCWEFVGRRMIKSSRQ